MEESYGEGVASHTGPESCGRAREGADEALTGVRAGRVWSREIVREPGVPMPWDEAEGHTVGFANARSQRTPRGRRPRACAETPRTGIGRSQGRLTAEGPAGRTGKPKGTSR
jgi:RNA-directed DNA polymerase